jgi:hypothetical protein
LIRIIDGEKVFTFKYSEITVQIEER